MWFRYYHFISFLINIQNLTKITSSRTIFITVKLSKNSMKSIVLKVPNILEKGTKLTSYYILCWQRIQKFKHLSKICDCGRIILLIIYLRIMRFPSFSSLTFTENFACFHFFLVHSQRVTLPWLPLIDCVLFSLFLCVSNIFFFN